MSAFSAINLSNLPAPDVVEQIEYEPILTALKADLVAREPALASVIALESEPITKLLEVCAYRETVIRQRANDSCRAVMLPYAAGADLDQLGALMGVVRQVVTEGDDTVYPPVPPVYEDDERLRARIQLAPEAYTVAGSKGSYIWHALAADPTVLDVDCYAPETEGDYVGEVRVTILSTEGDGTPDGALLSTVTAALSADQVRPLTDRVYVQAPTIVEYTITASIWCYEGPDPVVVMAAAEASVTELVASLHRLGHDVTRSAVMAALHQPGVQRVELTAPGENLTIDNQSASWCTDISLNYEGTAL